jgi:hypothetical protein
MRSTLVATSPPPARSSVAVTHALQWNAVESAVAATTAVTHAARRVPCRCSTLSMPSLRHAIAACRARDAPSPTRSSKGGSTVSATSATTVSSAPYSACVATALHESPSLAASSPEPPSPPEPASPPALGKSTAKSSA